MPRSPTSRSSSSCSSISGALRDYANEHGIRLFGDMPIYIALDSADAWATRNCSGSTTTAARTSVAGVPPDYFSEDGQLWGNPLYDWEVHAANGYRWWVERLGPRRNWRISSASTISAALKPTGRCPADSETARTRRLGARPRRRDIRCDERRRWAICPLLPKTLASSRPKSRRCATGTRFPAWACCSSMLRTRTSTSTDVGAEQRLLHGHARQRHHAGLVQGQPGRHPQPAEIEATRQAALRKTGGTPETIHLDLIRAAFSTKARLAIAPMQDYLGLGSEARINTPGKAGGNWRWRVLDSQLSPELCDNTASLVIASKRGLY